MFQKLTDLADLSPDLAAELQRTHAIAFDYLASLQFILFDTSRNPNFANSHLLYFISQDLLQSALALPLMAIEGLLTAAKREIRFILECSEKACLVQQLSPASSVEQKLVVYKDEFKQSGTSVKRISLSLLDATGAADFAREVGRLHGETSNYVHLTPQQLGERIATSRSGKTVGKETPADVAELNALMLRGLGASLVLVLHAVPDYVAGDWLVDADGTSSNTVFMGSRFIAAIDEGFDYKHERKANLAKIIAARQAGLRF